MANLAFTTLPCTGDITKRSGVWHGARDLGKKFWEGYRSLIPQDEGFLDRKPLYDAYHQLNHYNLFGGGYIGSARSDLESLKKKLNAKEKS